MKRQSLLLLLSAILLGSTPAFSLAQDAAPGEGERPRPGFRGERGPGQGPGMRRGGPGSGGLDAKRASDRYLEKLRQENPQEYETIVRLREDDPEAFKQRLMERLVKMRKSMENMDPEQRDELRKRMLERRGSGQGPRPGMSPEEMEHKRKQYDVFKQKVDSIRTRYQNAADDAEREAIRSSLSQLVSTMFDARQNERRKHIERIRRELQHMESKMAEDEGKRAQYVGKRVDELLEK